MSFKKTLLYIVFVLKKNVDIIQFRFLNCFISTLIDIWNVNLTWNRLYCILFDFFDKWEQNH